MSTTKLFWYLFQTSENGQWGIGHWALLKINWSIPWLSCCLQFSGFNNFINVLSLTLVFWCFSDCIPMRVFVQIFRSLFVQNIFQEQPSPETGEIINWIYKNINEIVAQFEYHLTINLFHTTSLSYQNTRNTMPTFKE